MAKKLEEMKKTTFKQIILMKLMEKLTTKQEMQTSLEEIADELEIPAETRKIAYGTEKEETPDFETQIDVLTEALIKKDLERILKENGNNNH